MHIRTLDCLTAQQPFTTSVNLIIFERVYLNIMTKVKKDLGVTIRGTDDKVSAVLII